MADSYIFTVLSVIFFVLWAAGSIFFQKELRQKRIRYYCAVTFFFLAGLCITKNAVIPDSIASDVASGNSKGIEVKITGTVSKIQNKQSYMQIYLKDVSIEYEGVIHSDIKKILVSTTENNCGIGDSIYAEGTLKEFSPPRNTGEFDSRQYYRTINVMYRCTATYIEVIQKNENVIIKQLEKFKQELTKSYTSIAGETEAGIFKSVILGDKQDMEEEIMNLYQDNGIAHLLAISGLHVSVIGMSFYKVLRKTGLSFLICAVLSSILMIAYGIITGNAVSAVRAIIMFIISAGAGVKGRTYDGITALSAAAILLLWESPILLLNGGFLLSFGAIISIALVYPALEKVCFLKKEDKFFSAFLVSFSVTLTTLPVILFFYYEVPIYAVFLNMIVIPLMTFVMASGIAGGLLGLVSKAGGMFFIGIAHYILQFYEFLCIRAGKLPGVVLISGKPPLYIITIYYLLLAGLIFYANNNKKIVKKSLMIIPVMLIMITGRENTDLQVSMIDVGQGDCIFVRTTENITCLFDGGSSDIKQVGEYRILPFLKANGVRKLNYIFISHADEDHISGIVEILNMENFGGINIQKIVLPLIEDKSDEYAEFEAFVKNKEVELVFMQKGDVIQGKEFSLTCLYPEKHVRNLSSNETSMVLSLTYKEFDMLFVGDLERTGEDILLKDNELRHYEVLKVGHHGSENSGKEQFLNRVHPEIALISCGVNNRYGHPHAKLLARLERIDAQQYITSECGEITIRTNGAVIKTERFLKTNAMFNDTIIK